MTKIGRFLRGFSLVDLSVVGFLDLLKIFKTQRQKVMFLYTRWSVAMGFPPATLVAYWRRNCQRRLAPKAKIEKHSQNGGKWKSYRKPKKVKFEASRGGK